MSIKVVLLFLLVHANYEGDFYAYNFSFPAP